MRGPVLLLVVVALVFAAAGCGGGGNDGASSETTTAATTGGGTGDAVAGKEVFASAGCGGCHTFQAAGSSGSVGPNLDDAAPSYDKVVSMVSHGGGAMPSFEDDLTPKQIQDVAAFVSGS